MTDDIQLLLLPDDPPDLDLDCNIHEEIRGSTERIYGEIIQFKKTGTRPFISCYIYINFFIHHCDLDESFSTSKLDQLYPVSFPECRDIINNKTLKLKGYDDLPLIPLNGSSTNATVSLGDVENCAGIEFKKPNSLSTFSNVTVDMFINIKIQNSTLSYDRRLNTVNIGNTTLTGFDLEYSIDDSLGYVFWRTPEENCTEDFISMFKGEILKFSTNGLGSSEIHYSVPNRPDLDFIRKTGLTGLCNMQAASTLSEKIFVLENYHNENNFKYTSNENLRFLSTMEATLLSKLSAIDHEASITTKYYERQLSYLLCSPRTTVKDIKKRFAPDFEYEYKDTVSYSVLSIIIHWMILFIVLYYFIKVIVKVCTGSAPKRISRTYIINKTGRKCECLTPATLPNSNEVDV